jgi:hypothetical protein
MVFRCFKSAVRGKCLINALTGKVKTALIPVSG